MKKIVLLLALLGFSAGLSQTYVFQRHMDVRTLDPVGFYDNVSQSVIENVYEGLYGYRGPTGELEPRLATGYEISEDGRAYTFQLREGVTFHSGNPFTCRDVEYSFKRALISSAGSLTEAVLGAGVGHVSDLLGDDPAEADHADVWNRIDNSVECTDDMTAVIRVLEPDPILLARITTPRYFIVDSEWARAGGMWDGTEATWRNWIDADLTDHYLHDAMSGTGAYRLVIWEPDDYLTAERYARYWGPAPQIKTVLYEVVEDEAERIQALLAGHADQIDVLESPKSELAGQPGVRILDPAADPSLGWSLTSVWAVLFNYQIDADGNDYIGTGSLDGFGVPPDFFTDRDVRKCFAHAFDPEAYNQEEWDGGALTLAMAMLPHYEAYDPDIPQYGLDLERAEEHCRAAWDGQLWDNGMWLTIAYVPDYTASARVARQFQQNLEALNPRFAIDLREVTWDEYFAASDDLKLPIDVLGSPSSLPDPVDFIETWYTSANSWTGFYGYRHEEIDRLATEARTEFDDAKRAGNYRQIGRLGYDDAAFILLPNGPYVMVTRDNISGAYRNPAHAEVRWQDLTKAP